MRSSFSSGLGSPLGLLDSASCLFCSLECSERKPQSEIATHQILPVDQGDCRICS
jgi:hypothetical protein